MTLLPPFSFDPQRSPARPVAHDVLDLARMAAIDRCPHEHAANDSSVFRRPRTGLRGRYAPIAALPPRFRIR